MKPVWLITPYEGNNLTVPWRPITEKFMGEPVEFEFMRRAPVMVPRWAYAALTEFCHRKHGVHISEYIAVQPLRAFSEYNALGAFLYRYHRDKVHWIDTSKVPQEEWPELTVDQRWSYGGLTDEVKAEFEKILAEPPSPIMQTREGIWVLRNDSHISRWIEQHGRLQHDGQTLPEVLTHINEGDHVVDVGAHVGDTTDPFLDRVGSSGFVFAIEANPDAYECLVRNLKQRADDGNWTAVNYAASDEDLQTVGLSNDLNAGAICVQGSGSIPTAKIDSFNLGRLDFIKLDVEGFELRALRGAEATINRFHPKLLIEINHGALERQGASAEEIYAWLSAHGYEWREVVPSPDQPQNTPQTDILCTFQPKEAASHDTSGDNPRQTHSPEVPPCTASVQKPWESRLESLQRIKVLAEELRRYCTSPRQTSAVRNILKMERVTSNGPGKTKRRNRK